MSYYINVWGLRLGRGKCYNLLGCFYGKVLGNLMFRSRLEYINGIRLMKKFVLNMRSVFKYFVNVI